MPPSTSTPEITSVPILSDERLRRKVDCLITSGKTRCPIAQVVAEKVHRLLQDGQTSKDTPAMALIDTGMMMLELVSTISFMANNAQALRDGATSIHWGDDIEMDGERTNEVITAAQKQFRYHFLLHAQGINVNPDAANQSIFHNEKFYRWAVALDTVVRLGLKNERKNRIPLIDYLLAREESATNDCNNQ